MDNPSVWIPWEGGEQPMPDHRLVLVQLGSDTRVEAENDGPIYPTAFEWDHNRPHADRIIAYRFYAPSGQEENNDG